MKNAAIAGIEFPEFHKFAWFCKNYFLLKFVKLPICETGNLVPVKILNFWIMQSSFWLVLQMPFF